MAKCSNCGNLVEDGAAKCNICGDEIDVNNLSAPAINHAVASKILSIGTSLIGTAFIFIVLFVLFVPLPYPLGGNIALIIYSSLVSGTRLGGECSKDENDRLNAYLESGNQCLMTHETYRQLYEPTFTWAMANSRHSKSKKCLIEHVIGSGPPHVLKKLLESGADPNECPGSVDVVYAQLLHLPGNNRYIDFAMILREAKYYPKNPQNLLIEEAKQGSVIGVNRAVQLFSLYQSINEPDSDGKTPLYHAILVEPTSGSWATVKELIKLGADPIYSSSNSESPLSKAKRLYSGSRYQSKFESEFGQWLQVANK